MRIFLLNLKLIHSFRRGRICGPSSGFAITQTYARLRSRPLLFKTVSIVKNCDFVVHFFLFPPSAIFPHNRPLLFAVAKFAAHLRYIGAYGPLLSYGSFICYHLCTNRRFFGVFIIVATCFHSYHYRRTVYSTKGTYRTSVCTFCTVFAF